MCQILKDLANSDEFSLYSQKLVENCNWLICKSTASEKTIFTKTSR